MLSSSTHKRRKNSLKVGDSGNTPFESLGTDVGASVFQCLRVVDACAAARTSTAVNRHVVRSLTLPRRIVCPKEERGLYAAMCTKPMGFYEEEPADDRLGTVVQRREQTLAVTWRHFFANELHTTKHLESLRLHVYSLLPFMLRIKPHFSPRLTSLSISFRLRDVAGDIASTSLTGAGVFEFANLRRLEIDATLTSSSPFRLSLEDAGNFSKLSMLEHVKLNLRHTSYAKQDLEWLMQFARCLPRDLKSLHVGLKELVVLSLRCDRFLDALPPELSSLKLPAGMPDHRFRFPLTEIKMSTNRLRKCERDLPRLRSLVLDAVPSRSNATRLERDLLKCRNIEKLTLRLRHVNSHFGHDYSRGYELPALANLHTLHLDSTCELGLHSKPLVDSLAQLACLHTLRWFANAKVRTTSPRELGAILSRTRLTVFSTSTRTLSVFHVREVMHVCSLRYLFVSMTSRVELNQLIEAHEDEDPYRKCECVLLVEDD